MRKLRDLVSTSNSRRNSFRLSAAAAASLGVMGASGAARADYFWNGAVADYNTPNWTHYDYTQTPNVVTPLTGPPQGVGNDYNTLNGTGYTDPTTNALVILTGGVVSITPSDPAWQVNDLRSGSYNGTTGTYIQSGSTVNVNGGFLMGDVAGGTGTYNMSGGLVSVTGYNNGNGGINQRTDIGEAGVGVLNMTGGTFNQGNSHFSIADDQDNTGLGGFGTVNISNATINDLQNELWVGNNNGNANGTLTETGVLNVASGGVVNVGSWLVPGRFGATGTINIYGTGVVNKLTNNGEVQVGVNGGSVGVVNIQDQGTFNTTGGAIFDIAEGGGSTGTVNVSGNATLNSSADIWVSNGGNGFLNISGGTVTTGGWLVVGRSGGNGVINLSGGQLIKSNGSGGNTTFAGTSGTLNQTGGLFMNATSETWIGESGNNLYNMSGGTAVLGNVNVGYDAPGGTTGAWTLSGNAAATAATVFLGRISGNGTLSLSGNSVLSAAQVVRGFTSGTVSVQLNTGATLQATTATPNFIQGFNSGEFVVNGGNIDTNGLTVGISTGLSGTGGFTKVGAGTLQFSSTNSTYTGKTIVSSGTLQLAAPQLVIPASTVAAYYSFEDPNPANIGNDTSGNGNNLLLGSYDSNGDSGNVVPSTNAPSGHAGSASFSNKGYLTTAGGTTPASFPLGNSAYTLGAWVKLDGTNTGANGIIGWGTYGNNQQVNAFRTASTTSLLNYWWNNDFQTNSPDLTAAWHYVAVTYDPSFGTAGTRSMYVDGNLVGSNDPGSADAATMFDFAVGVTDNLNEYLSGNLADLIVANTAYTPAQLAVAAANTWQTAMTTGGSISPASVVQISSGAVFDVNGSTQTVAGLIGPGGSSVTLGSGTLTVSPATAGEFDGTISETGALTVGGTAPLILGGANTYGGATTVNPGSFLVVTGAGSLASTTSLVSNGTTTFQSSTGSGILTRNLLSVTVGTGGLVALQPATNHLNRTLLVTSNVTISGTGQMDIGNNDLDLTGASLSTISGYVAAGYNLVGGANWNGAGGITSTTAASNSTHLTAVGVVQNNQSGSPLFTPTNQFDGTTPGLGDILVKYTYFGDANLDGKVDGSDYSLIDAGYASQGTKTGWFYGDFNYDGVVDGSDYALIDNAFNNQGLSLTSNALVAADAAQFATAGPSAVPEPASIGLLAVAAIGLAGRRRARHGV